MCNPAAWTATKAFAAKAFASTAGKAVVGAVAGAAASKVLTPSINLPEIPTAAPSATETIDQGALVARDRARRRAQMAFGRKSTMLTGATGAGLPGGAGKSLLGS